MDDELLFRILLLLLIVGFVAHRAYYTKKHGRPESDTIKEREGGKTAIVANILSLLAFASTILYLVNPAWMAWASLPFPDWLRWLGVGIAILGFALLEWSHRALGRNWSDTPRLMKEQTLTTNGPYHWVRHPIYTAFLLILGSPLLISANWFIGLSWLLATLIDVIARVRYEEGILAEQFGGSYDEYIKETGALIPRLPRRSKR